MTNSTNPASRILDLFQYPYNHNPRKLLHHTQFANKIGIPPEPFYRILQASIGPWLRLSPTKGDNVELHYWFTREMLDLWRHWLLKSAPSNDLVAAIRIIIDWDNSQPRRDYSLLDDRAPHEYFS